MKKKELIQVHRTLALIKETAVEQEAIDGTPNYDDLAVQPNGLHNSKDDHKEAIIELSSELADKLEDAEGDIDLTSDNSAQESTVDSNTHSKTKTLRDKPTL